MAPKPTYLVEIHQVQHLSLGSASGQAVDLFIIRSLMLSPAQAKRTHDRLGKRPA